MTGERFTLDTNILVYADAPSPETRRAVAQDVLDLAAYGDCCLTLQSLSEFYAVTTRKNYLTVAAAAHRISQWLDLYATAAVSAGAVRKALASTIDRSASYWDALLVATAAEAGCTAILTEDMADGTTLHGVRIVNPFGPAGLSPEAARLLETG